MFKVNRCIVSVGKHLGTGKDRGRAPRIDSLRTPVSLRFFANWRSVGEVRTLLSRALYSSTDGVAIEFGLISGWLDPDGTSPFGHSIAG